MCTHFSVPLSPIKYGESEQKIHLKDSTLVQNSQICVHIRPAS